jgi:hypothetical protein
MHERIEARLDKFDVYYNAATSSTREEADEIMPWSKIMRLEDDDRLLRHVRKTIEEAHERREKNERTKPLCRCADRACPVKEGRVPPQITPRRESRPESPGVESRIDAYVNDDHPDVIVAEALDSWIDEHAEILPKITRAVGLLEDEVETGREGLLHS